MVKQLFKDGPRTLQIKQTTTGDRARRVGSAALARKEHEQISVLIFKK